MKYSLYFINAEGKERLLGKYGSKQEWGKRLSEFLAQHNYKSYYYRYNTLSHNEMTIDVGSHSEFFKVVIND